MDTSCKYYTAVLHSPSWSPQLSVQTIEAQRTKWYRPNTLDSLRLTAMGLDGLPAWFLRVAASVFCQTITYLFNLSLVTSTVPLQWKKANIHPIPKSKQEAYLHPISITAILERKYNGNETDIVRFISFHFKFSRFHFVSVFCYFLVSVSVFVNGIKIFPLTDISVFVSVNVNHTVPNPEVFGHGQFNVVYKL